MFNTVIECNTFTSMDRVLLEGWLLSNSVPYKIGKYGNMLAKLEWDQIETLRDEGWVVRIL